MTGDPWLNWFASCTRRATCLCTRPASAPVVKPPPSYHVKPGTAWAGATYLSSGIVERIGQVPAAAH